MASNKDKTIMRVSWANLERLKEYGLAGESYNDALTKVLTRADKHKALFGG